MENALRLAKGLVPLKDLEELEESDAVDDPAAEDEDEDPTNEAVLAEAGEVLLDLIGFRHQVAMIGDAAKSRPRPRRMSSSAANRPTAASSSSESAPTGAR